MTSVISTVKRTLRFTQAISLDIVGGVLCGGYFAATMTDADLPLSWYFLLGMATWVIYLVDHLLDAASTRLSGMSWRHWAVSRRRRRLLPFVVAFCVIAPIVAIQTLPRIVLPIIPFVVLAVVAHLYWAQRAKPHWLPKEFTAATIYVLGIWFVPLLVGRFSSWTLILLALHWVAALLNLTAFSQFDWRADRLQGRCSVVRDWGRRVSVGLVLWLGLAASLGVAAIWLVAPPAVSPAALALLPLTLAPPLLLRNYQWFATADRYRLADGLFFLLALPPATL